MELKNFVDFAYSLNNMNEVKNGIFPLPEEIVFNLDKSTHVKIHKKIKEEKSDTDYNNLDSEFDIDIFGVNFRFKSNED